MSAGKRRLKCSLLKNATKRGVPPRAFVTGAASGLGQRFCQELLSKGVSLAAFDLHFDSSARNALESMATPGQKVEFYTADVSDANAVAAAVDQAIDDVEAPDLVIHSAGICEPSTFLETSAESFTRSININLIGTRNVAAAALPVMAAGSHIVLVASLAGISANYSYAGYSASKFGVVGLTEVLRMEMIERDIDVTSLCPAEIMTPMVLKEQERVDPIRIKLKAFAGSMELDQACTLIMQGIAARKPRLVPGFRAKLTVLLTHVMPGLARKIARHMIRSELGRERAAIRGKAHRDVAGL
ncbi:SDR family NAD(P)-dependent oxidoreductase [uncultured Tateyamaria sp.]|uniref:SDR family NAD(P)-dependent oxidoreductase n=1 Tax=uncultured Tateyamaria sp. TaxID=455651 RepID=UPI00262A4414|nr:SDR family NAD(P)-dependent oxidoreductase [uncultured Tateyamaria sp.]